MKKKITVVIGSSLYHGAVSYRSRIDTNIIAVDIKGMGFNMLGMAYDLRQENISWVAGHIPLDGDEAKALLTAHALTRENA